MRDYDHRTVLHQVLQGFLHQPLGLRIQMRRRFVQNQNRSILQQRPCDRQALPLSARELHAALADHGFIAVR